MWVLGKRPHTVTFVLWGVFFLCIWNALKALTLGQQSGYLLELGATPDPRIRLVVAIIWTLLFGGAAWTLKQKQPFTQYIIPGLMTIYAIYETSLLVWFTQVPPDWRLNGLIYLISITLSYWALNKKSNQYYFRKGENREVSS